MSVRSRRRATSSPDAASCLDQATYGKIIQSLFWATGYNAAAIPLAAGVGYGAGILPSPAVGAALMSLSTISNVSPLSIARTG